MQRSAGARGRKQARAKQGTTGEAFDRLASALCALSTASTQLSDLKARNVLTADPVLKFWRGKASSRAGDWATRCAALNLQILASAIGAARGSTAADQRAAVDAGLLRFKAELARRLAPRLPPPLVDADSYLVWRLLCRALRAPRPSTRRTPPAAPAPPSFRAWCVLLSALARMHDHLPEDRAFALAARDLERLWSKLLLYRHVLAFGRQMPPEGPPARVWRAMDQLERRPGVADLADRLLARVLAVRAKATGIRKLREERQAWERCRKLP